MKGLTPAFTHGSTTPTVGRTAVGAWAAQIAVIGFVAGHSCLPNMEFHLGWLLIAALPALACTEWTPHLQRWKADAGALSIISFVLWMLLRSCWQIPFMPEHALGEITRGIVGAMLLVIFCALLWLEAQSKASLHAMGWVMGMTSALAALISIGLSYFVLPYHLAGGRLMNLLVHGGLNPVCTGLIFGFAAVWLAALVENLSKPVPSRIAWAAIALLHLSAFLSGSRGAMLAMAGGHAVLLLARGWRRGRMAACVFLLAGLFYFTSAPLFARINHWRAQPEAATPTSHGITHHFQKAVARGDNSRRQPAPGLEEPLPGGLEAPLHGQPRKLWRPNPRRHARLGESHIWRAPRHRLPQRSPKDGRPWRAQHVREPLFGVLEGAPTRLPFERRLAKSTPPRPHGHARHRGSGPLRKAEHWKCVAVSEQTLVLPPVGEALASLASSGSQLAVS